MSDLEPCPFCGGTTGRFATDAGSSSYIGKWGWWECDCGARAEDVRTGYDADGWQNFAIAAWNRRAPSAAFRAGAAEMRERVEKGLTNHAEQLRASAERALARGDKDQSAFTHGKATAIEVALIAIRALPLPAAASGWQPIETAPRDGTVIDIWADGERIADVYWGKPDHCCGEMGQYCDSDWHREKPGWVVCAINASYWGSKPPTHWQPLPAEPEEDHAS